MKNEEIVKLAKRAKKLVQYVQQKEKIFNSDLNDFIKNIPFEKGDIERIYYGLQTTLIREFINKKVNQVEKILELIISGGETNGKSSPSSSPPRRAKTKATRSTKKTKDAA